MHVVVNAAVSADGKLSTRRREQVAISGPEDFARVEELRAESDAVAVGVGTVLADDPHLTVDEPELRAEREARGEPAQPARVVVDSRGRTPTDARVLDDAAETFVLVSGAATPERREALAEAGAEVIAVEPDPDESGTGAAGAPDAADAAAGDDEVRAAVEAVDDSEAAAGDRRVDLAAGLAALEDRGIDQLMVEGGGELLFSLFEAGLVDDCSTFVGPTVIGGRDAPTLADGDGFVEEFVDLELRDVERLDGGVLLTWAVTD